MRTILLGILSGCLLFSAGCTAAPATSSGSAPSGSASEAPLTPASLTDKLQADSNLSFTVPKDFTTEAMPDNELRLTKPGDCFIAVAEDDSIDAAFDAANGQLKRIGQLTYRATEGPHDDEQGGLKTRAAGGTLSLAGKPATWRLLVFDNGKKALRIVAMGADLKSSATLNALLASVKKKP